MKNKIMPALACLVCFGTGGFILFSVRTFGGASLGATFILLGLAIGFQLQLKDGVTTLKAEADEIDPVVDKIRKAVPGGS